jgi:succinoglycan biosynthesis transport protein ExoP
MELRQYLAIVGRWSWLIILSIIIAATASFLASKSATPLYRTNTTLMVGRIIQDPDPNSADLYTGQQLANTYSQLVRREPVLDGVIDSLGLPMTWEALANQVSANNVPQTQLLEISVIDSDAYRAKVVADEIAQQLILQSPSGPSDSDQDQVAFTQSQISDLREKILQAQQEEIHLKQELDAANSALQIQDLQNQINVLETKISGWQDTYSKLLLTLEGGDINALTVVSEASIPSRPISPNVRMNVLLAVVIGLILAVGGIFIIEYLDDTIKTSEEGARVTGLPILGSINRIHGDNYHDKLVAIHDPLSPVVEGFRVLSMNLQYSSNGEPPRSLMITSPEMSDGKSLSLANLAVVMAKGGLKVIAVDADLRKPTLHEIFNLHNTYGLSDQFLPLNPGVSEHLQVTGIENLQILTSGPIPPSPAELLGSARMTSLIEELKSQADIVLFDTPPCLLVADSSLLGTQLDGAVLVFQAGRTSTKDARRAVEEFRRVNINLLGMLLNTQNSRKGGNYKYYNYYYGTDSGSKSKIRTIIKEAPLQYIKHDKADSGPEQNLWARMKTSTQRLLGRDNRELESEQNLLNNNSDRPVFPLFSQAKDETEDLASQTKDSPNP